MRTITRIRALAALCLLLALAPSLAGAAMPEGASWRYYRAGNTGVQGDASSALWIDDNDLLYACCYVASWEEGGFAHFVPGENRWVNVSNVDYPVLGDPSIVGSSRISDIEAAADGTLWMGTWIGALHYDPAIGPGSLVRYDGANSPHPGGRTFDVSVAPDGSVWFAVYSLGPNNGGVVRYVPGTDTWTVWGYGSNANGWPGWNTTRTASVQPKPGGGYVVWIDDAFGRASFDSDTQQFTTLANNSQAGDIMSIVKNGVDAAGNAWMLRYTTPGQLYTLEFRRPDGSWGAPSTPLGAIELDAFRATGPEQFLVVLGDDVWQYDGALWHNLGAWGGAGAFTAGLDMDSQGDVWVSGNGGVARRSAETGDWQRYRVTNTSQMDYWVRDISFGANGEVWMTGNAAPGIGGIAMFDGLRWTNWNVLTYGLGGDWPFACDNADAITYRPSTGNVGLNPTNHGLHDWNGSTFLPWEANSSSEGLAEDSLGRLWTVGTYFSLRYYADGAFTSVPIAGWGANVVRDPDRPGTVWACANLEVVRTDGNYRYSRLNTELPELNPLHDVLTKVAVGRDGVAWVGSTEGLFRLDAEAGTHQWWHSSNSALPGDQVTPLAVTPDGRVWFTNFNSNGIEASLVWFDGSEFGTVTRADGLPHAQIYDAEQRNVEGGYELWLSCASMGVAVLSVPLADPTSAPGGDLALEVLTGSPNPFRETSAVRFALTESGPVRLDVFDVQGRHVRTLVDGLRPAGEQRAIWDGRDDAARPQPSGVYFVRLRAGAREASGRLVLLR
ncbi:MAG: FlgD immunoglobulin-like domain containing protein [Candidatus Krumholzibacteriia bacterium]